MTNNLVKYIAISILMFLSSGLNAATVVIVNSANPDTAITKKVAKKIFMGKASSTGSAEVIPVDQEEGSQIRGLYYSKVANKSRGKMKSYWSKMIFSGKAVPPEVVIGDAAVIAWVSKHKDAIGYVDSQSVSGEVKVILELP